MTIENFSGEAQSFERGSNLYAQVTPDLRGGFEIAKPNSATASNYLPEVQLQDAGVNFISTPGRLGGDERRKAAEKSPQQETQQKEQPKENKPQQQEQKPNELPKKEQPKENKPQQQEQKPNELPKKEQPKENKPQQQEQKPNELPSKEQPKESKPQQQEQKPNELPKKEQPKENKPQQQEQKPNELPKKEQPKDCVDYGSRGAKVMEKPTNWTPDTELKTKQGRDWNNHAKELRNKPLKADKDGNYEVQYGDSLWGIAERSVKGKTGKAASPAETFAEMQRIVGMNADKLGSQSNWQMIKPGMQLRIKGDNPCEVPSQNGAPQERPRVAQNDVPQSRPRVAQTDAPKDRPGVNQNGSPGERPRVAQTDAPKDRPPVNQNGSPGERPRVAQTDAPQDRPGVVQTERTTIGDKGQKVSVDAQDRITKIDYPNGNHVKFEYSGTSKEISKATITGNGQNVEMVKNGDHYKVLENGKETSDKVLKIELNKDGSAVITGTSYGMKGQKIVRTDGSTENKYLGNAA